MDKYHKQVKLKSAISELALEYVASEKGMTVGQYGSVYDSEAWERMLNSILNQIEEQADD